MKNSIFKLCTLIISLLITSTAFTAGPAFHLWTAEKFCDIRGIPNDSARKEIYIGTEFPDIRYMANLPRELTHLTVLDVQEILQSQSPFETGMRIHSWLDHIRDTHVSQIIYDALTPYCDGNPIGLLKIIEEEILADIYDGRPSNPHFESLLSEELVYAKEGIVWKWHKYVQHSIAFRPSWYLWVQSFQGPAYGVSAQTLYNWSYLLPKLKKEPLFKDHLYKMLSLIETELEKLSVVDPYTIYQK